MEKPVIISEPQHAVVNFWHVLRAGIATTNSVVSFRSEVEMVKGDMVRVLIRPTVEVYAGWNVIIADLGMSSTSIIHNLMTDDAGIKVVEYLYYKAFDGLLREFTARFKDTALATHQLRIPNDSDITHEIADLMMKLP